MNKYWGFDGLDGMRTNFQVKKDEPLFPTEEEVLFAAYGGGGYDGTAHVLFTRDGKLYEVNGSHCSCFGLEDQWTPEETTWDAIKLRPSKLRTNGPYDSIEVYNLHSYDFEKDTLEFYKNLVESN